MKVILIAAMDENNALGFNGDLPWRLPTDFAHFKRSTLNKTIVMGYATAISIPAALPKRRNWVLSRTRQAPYADMETFRSIDEVMARARQEGLDELWVVGGGVVYEQFMELATDLIITHVHANVPQADAWFPQIDPDVWKGEEVMHHSKDDKNEHDFVVVHYQKFIRL